MKASSVNCESLVIKYKNFNKTFLNKQLPKTFMIQIYLSQFLKSFH